MKTKKVITIILLFLSLASCATTDYSKVRYAQPNDPIYFDRESNFTPRSKVQVRTVMIEPYNAELSTKDTTAYQQKAQELKTKIIPEALADSGFFLPGVYNTDQSSTHYLDMSLHADIWDSGKSRGQKQQASWRSVCSANWPRTKSKYKV